MEKGRKIGGKRAIWRQSLQPNYKNRTSAEEWVPDAWLWQKFSLNPYYILIVTYHVKSVALHKQLIRNYPTFFSVALSHVIRLQSRNGKWFSWCRFVGAGRIERERDVRATQRSEPIHEDTKSKSQKTLPSKVSSKRIEFARFLHQSSSLVTGFNVFVT